MMEARLVKKDHYQKITHKDFRTDFQLQLSIYFNAVFAFFIVARKGLWILSTVSFAFFQADRLKKDWTKKKSERTLVAIMSSRESVYIAFKMESFEKFIGDWLGIVYNCYTFRARHTGEEFR